LSDGTTAWIQSLDGQLIAVRLSDGAILNRLQHSLVYNFSSPAIVARMLVVGDQNGVVAGIRLP
jgi:hypothetical protein